MKDSTGYHKILIKAIKDNILTNKNNSAEKQQKKKGGRKECNLESQKMIS